MTSPSDETTPDIDSAENPEESAAHEPNDLLARMRPGATVAGGVFVVLAIVWAIAGAATSVPAACSGCHADAVHAKAGETDPHRSTACVTCHEPGGWMARVTWNLPMRVQHYLQAGFGSVQEDPFGQIVGSVGCAECHADDIDSPLDDPTRGIKMSHSEPLAAGAECMDCHLFKGGRVVAATRGMSMCVRCHDGTKAKATCLECHDSDPVENKTMRVSQGDISSRLVPTPSCTQCHVDQSSCRKCHGATLPKVQSEQ